MRIETVEQLRVVLGQPNETTQAKIYSRLTDQAIEFVKRSPLMIVATADRNGMPTASPKGDAPGFVHVEGDNTLLIPERLGNKLASSFRNILENPRVGLFFFVPRCVETLRISGTAELLHDATLAEELKAMGKPALLTMRVHVTESYFQCGKALIRSSFWKPETWPAESTVSFGREIGDNLGKDATFASELDARIQLRYCDSLY
jgi:PPOX class probable FMN-dependent enzyme